MGAAHRCRVCCAEVSKGKDKGKGEGGMEGPDGVRCGVRAGERPHPRAKHAPLVFTCYFADKSDSAIVVFSARMASCRGWQF